MAKQTRKPVLPGKVTPIIKKVVAKQKKSVEKYPYYIDARDEEKHLTFANMMEDKYDGEAINGVNYGFTKVINEKEEVFFGYDVTAAPHTCGFLEIGEINVYCSSEKNLSHLAELLDNMVGFSKGYTMFMNTNGIDDSKILEKTLPLSKHWVKVKTYKNPGSGNMLTLWVTNN